MKTKKGSTLFLEPQNIHHWKSLIFINTKKEKTNGISISRRQPDPSNLLMKSIAS